VNADQKLDKLAEDISGIKVDLSAMKVDVAYHIRRSDTADENLSLLRKDFKPIQRHVVMVEGALKLIGGVSVLVGIGAAVAQIIQTIKG
jgi:hypothetical protein